MEQSALIGVLQYVLDDDEIYDYDDDGAIQYDDDSGDALLVLTDAQQLKYLKQGYTKMVNSQLKNRIFSTNDNLHDGFYAVAGILASDYDASATSTLAYAVVQAFLAGYNAEMDDDSQIADVEVTDDDGNVTTKGASNIIAAKSGFLERFMYIRGRLQALNTNLKTYTTIDEVDVVGQANCAVVQQLLDAFDSLDDMKAISTDDSDSTDDTSSEE